MISLSLVSIEKPEMEGRDGATHCALCISRTPGRERHRGSLLLAWPDGPTTCLPCQPCRPDYPWPQGQICGHTQSVGIGTLPVNFVISIGLWNGSAGTRIRYAWREAWRAG